MNFCGTIELARRSKMNSLYFYASGLSWMLVEMNLPASPTSGQEQPSLFKLDQQRCKDFEQMAKTLRWFKRDKPAVRGEAFWTAYREIEYSSTDFYPVFQSFDDATLEKFAGELEKISKNETLPDHIPLSQFLQSLADRAHARYHDGGCF